MHLGSFALGSFAYVRVKREYKKLRKQISEIILDTQYFPRYNEDIMISFPIF